LISGGSIADTVGWRWSQYIVAIIDGVVFVLLFFSFEETMFPRFLFSSSVIDAVPTYGDAEKDSVTDPAKDPAKLSTETNLRAVSHATADQALVQKFPKRSYRQKLRPWVHYPENKTTFMQYFRRPFFLWGFPNVVIVSTWPPHTLLAPLGYTNFLRSF
jgi:hypothetical protein